MSKLRKSVMMLGLLLTSSAAFVGCNDDNDFPKNTLGASFIQQITAYTTSVDLRWTITPTDNVEGYQIQIFEGSRDNMNTTAVASGTFGKKEATGTFTGLKPNTTYTVASQCIPASGSGFTDADVAYFEFYTAPVLTITNVSAVVSPTLNALGEEETKEVPVIGEDGKPEMVPEVDENGDPVYDDDGEPVMVPKMETVTVYQAKVTLNYSPSLTIVNIGGIYYYAEDEEGNQAVYALYNMPDDVTTMPNPITFTMSDVNPGGTYYFSLFPYPSEWCFYTTASVEWSADYIYTLPTAE